MQTYKNICFYNCTFYLFINFIAIKNYYQKIQLLSIDVALGASCTAILFYILTRKEVYLPALISLSLVVWLVYTFDHLLDGKKIKKDASSARHRFHQKYFKQLLIIWLAILVFTAIFTFAYLPETALKAGIIVSLLVVLHFYLISRVGDRVSIYIQKEFGIALIFSIGVAIPALSADPRSIDLHMVLVFLRVFILASINLFEFSYFELDIDTKEQHASLARAVGERKTKALIYSLIIISLVGGIIQYLCFRGENDLLINGCLTLMTAIFLIILKYENYFRETDRFRLWGDSVFFIPLTLLLLKL